MKTIGIIILIVSTIEYFYRPRLDFGKHIYLWYGTRLRKHIKLL